MSDPIKHESTPSHGSYERQDISARGIFYFIAGLLAATLLISLLLSGLYKILDKRFETGQPPVNPLAAIKLNGLRSAAHACDDFQVGLAL